MNDPSYPYKTLPKNFWIDYGSASNASDVPQTRSYKDMMEVLTAPSRIVDKSKYAKNLKELKAGKLYRGKWMDFKLVNEIVDKDGTRYRLEPVESVYVEANEAFIEEMLQGQKL